MRIAFVAARWGDPWHEEQLFARRVAAVLASEAEVDVLVAGRDRRLGPTDGALTVRQFEAEGADPGLYAHLARFTVDAAGAGEALSCSCGRRLLEDVARRVPENVQVALVQAGGGHSPALYDHLADNAYDAVVAAGSSPVLAFGLPRRTRLVLTSTAPGNPTMWLPIFDDAFKRANTLVASTEAEREALALRRGGEAGVANVGFALRVSGLSAETDPVVGIEPPYLLAVADWTRSLGFTRLLRHTALLALDLPEVKVVFAGRGHERARHAGRMTAYGTELRPDLWRWMSRAAAVVDPEPARMLARDVLEAFLYGVPALVRADGGAGREHAQAGNGGLWYRNYDELQLAVSRLAAEGTGRMLGQQGREYAQREYGDPERFRQRVIDACLG